MNDQTSATSSPPRFRFLSAKRHALPKSILFFVCCLAFLLSIISTLALLRFALPKRPALESIVIAVPEYQSIDITANPFAVADAKSMERALGSKASLLIPKDLSDLEQSLTFEPKNRRDPLVVYIDMASTSSGEQGYLLTTDAKSLNVSNAYSIRNLLEQIWQITVPHKLLILNTNHSCRNLRTGILDNDFSYFLKTEFNALTKRANNTAGTAGTSNNTIQSNSGNDSTESFIVLCSSADGQSNWGSPSLGHTPFAALISYCISGGEKADRPSIPGGKSDGVISVLELSQFVTEQTACWSNMNRQTPQTPIVLRYGDDFPIATVNPWNEQDLVSSNKKVDNTATASSTASNDQQKNSNKVQGKDSPQESPTSNAPKAATSEAKKDTQDGNADTTVQSPSPATVASSSGTEMAGLLNRLMLIWQQQHDLQGNPSTRWQPNNWSAMHQLLLQAEGNLIAGESAICQQRLEQAEAIVNELESWQPTNLQWDWSIIFADRNDAPANLIAEKNLIEAFLRKPTPEALEKLDEPQSVEGQLLVSLARQHSIDWVVKEVSAVRLAIENKSLAAIVASHREPLVNRVVLPYLKEADRQSRQGQVHLFATRIIEATDAFRKARVEYRRTMQLSEITADQLATVESTLVKLPFYIDWIGNLPTASLPRESCVKSLQLLIENFHAFQASPQTNQLDLLVAICIDFTNLVEDHVAHELSSGDYRTIRTVLYLPTIGVDQRRNALEFVLSRKDEAVPIDGAVAPVDTFSTNSSGHAFPLSAFLSFFNQLQPHVQVPVELLESLHESGSQDLPPIKTKSPQLSRLSQIFRGFLSETEKPSSNSDTKATPWQQHWQTLVLAYWLNQPTMNPRDADSESMRIYKAALTRSLRQAYDRLVEDSRYLPKGTYDDSLSSMARSLERDSDQFQRDLMLTPAQLISSTEIQLSGSDQNTVPIQVLLPDQIPDGEIARIRLNWDDEKLALELSNAVIIPGQMTVDLGTVAAGQLLSIQPTIIEKEPVASFAVHEIIVSIQFMKPESVSSIREISHVKWLPNVTITAEGTPQKRADLIVSWNDTGATPNQVDLLPNQAITLNLSVQPNVTEPLALTLKARKQTEILGTVQIKDGKPSPIKPQEGPGFVINEAAVTFELYENDNLVDEETVAVRILDLDDCLQRQVTFNPRQRTATASLQQTQFSDSLAPVHFQLGTTEGETIPGRLSLSLEPEHNTGSMEAQFAKSTLLPTDVSISASGVPRLFRYSVYPELVNCPPQRGLVLYWDTPTPKTVFQFKAGQQMLLPIAAQIDGPRNLNIQMGFDQNNNSILEQNEVQLNEELWFGRIVKSQLVPTKDGFSVASHVTDMVTTLDVSGLAGRQNLITRATCDDDQCQETVPLYFIDSAPQVAIVEPAQGAEIAPGSDVHVVLQGQENSAGAINHVDFGFDMNNNDVLDKNEMVKPIDVSQGPISFDEFSQLSVHLPTKGLKPGKSNLLVQTQTLVHDLSEPDKKPELILGNVLNRTIEVSDTGSLVGRVSTADGVPTENAIVTVFGYPAQLTGKDGAFEFLGLPPGKHVIAAETSIRSVAAIAEVKAGETSRLALQLRLK